MSDAKLTIRLTSEQQKQVLEATGKSYTELTFDHIQSGKLTERALGAVVGGDQTVTVPGEDTVGGHGTYKPF
jgi:hypothetical protein